MALISLINSLKKISLITPSCVKPLLTTESQASNVMKDFVRHVGRDNIYKYIRGRKRFCYKRIVHYPDKYTITPLKVTRLGGRDRFTGRVVAKLIGGGIKYKYRWVMHKRGLEPNQPDIVERVVSIVSDRSRTGQVALVAHEDKPRWIIATENMKVGDLIRTSSQIPSIPVRPNEGDCYPLGALPVGTNVNSVEIVPGGGGYYAKAAGTFCIILKKDRKRVVLQIPSKHEISVDERCAAVVGRISNINHNKTILGSAQANRHLGNRPHSGLWHRKDGYAGRKIRRPPPMKIIGENTKRKPTLPLYNLSL